MTAGDLRYEVTPSSINIGEVESVRYSITNRFMCSTTAHLTDIESGRTFRMGQGSIGQEKFGTLILLEGQQLVGRFERKWYGSNYDIQVRNDVPSRVVLLAVWVAMIKTAFYA